MRKPLTNIRSYAEDRDRLKQVSRELSNIQQTEVTVPKVINRMLNIPDLREVLRKDAEIKMRRGIK